MPYYPQPRLAVWGSNIEEGTIQQAAKASRLPIIESHVALMPDAHIGIGATVGSVIPTRDAIIPSAVGVDIGCGMIAAKTSISAADLPDNLDSMMPLVEERIPAGVGKGHERQPYKGFSWSVFSNLGFPWSGLTAKQVATSMLQHGTLGSGNHFVEVCLDSDDQVWCVLHSGSRGIGNQLAQFHMRLAKKLCDAPLEDKDLAYFTQGTDEFEHYITDMLWAQRYAFTSRTKMMKALLVTLQEVTDPDFRVLDEINCHHNFTSKEVFDGKLLWITRKGAIKAYKGDRGIIPGSMGADTYIVSGKGVAESWCSCSHGAGRLMSRSQARRELDQETFEDSMQGRVWNDDRAKHLIDEDPRAYKPIAEVMADQSDLVRVDARLHQIFNYKG